MTAVDGAGARTETEVHLCERLRDWAERLGFDVYPEVHGWDMVLVLPTDAQPSDLERPRRFVPRLSHVVQPGQQVGIHAKLRANCDVIEQALPPPSDAGQGWTYPDLPFVAVPTAGAAFEKICRRLGVGVIETDPPRGQRWGQDAYPRVSCWPMYKQTHKALKLPPIASRAISAGAPSPRQLSTWRVSALRFLAFARAAGVWTIADLQRFGINRSWAERWGDIVETRAEVRRGRQVRVNVYRLTDKADALPDAGYADVAAELAAADAKGAA